MAPHGKAILDVQTFGQEPRRQSFEKVDELRRDTGKVMELAGQVKLNQIAVDRQLINEYYDTSSDEDDL